jgi:hypothetical protein
MRLKAKFSKEMLEMTITLIRLSEASNSFSGLLLVFFFKKKVHSLIPGHHRDLI